MRPPHAAVLGKLREFLPQMEAANKQLEQDLQVKSPLQRCRALLCEAWFGKSCTAQQ